MEALWLDENSSMSQSTHLKKIASKGHRRARLKFLGFCDGFLARLLIREPDIAVALGLQGCRIDGYLSRLDYAELLKDFVQVFSSDGLIETRDTKVALKMRIVWQIFTLTRMVSF